MRAFALAMFFFIALNAAAIDASNRYLSPRNPERNVRASTELIILHTTEAPARGSLNKLSDRGECHYCVTENGVIYRIIERDREAFHAGRSMWNAKEDVDKYSIGIECVGYHDKPMPAVQIAAIKKLVKELKSMYKLSDDKVICHSHVAYGAPNRWQKKAHRGRKRCGMQFAMPSARRALELKTRPAYDPDTRAKRLVVGDPYLEKVLYGRIDTMYRHYDRYDPGSSSSTGKGWFSGLFSRSKAVKPPKPAIRAASGTPASEEDLNRRGYDVVGVVSAKNTASKIAGKQWNSPDTYYTIRNKVIPGSKIDPARIEKGMKIWLKRR